MVIFYFILAPPITLNFFTKQIIETKLKLKNFRVLGLVIFKQIVIWVEEGGIFVLFLSLFSSVYTNFQDKLNSHESFFMKTVNLFPSIALLILYYLQVHGVFLILYAFNEYDYVSSLLGSALFCFLI